MVGSVSDMLRRASSADTSRELLDRLSYSDCAQVRAAVAANLNAPSLALSRLAHDEQPEVRSAAFSNPRLVRL